MNKYQAVPCGHCGKHIAAGTRASKFIWEAAKQFIPLCPKCSDEHERLCKLKAKQDRLTPNPKD